MHLSFTQFQMYIFIILVMSVIGAFGKLRHAVLSPRYKGEVSSFLPNLLSNRQVRGHWM